jgi:UDP-N-acetyl-D-glucosamine dehydrogenase
MNSTASDLQAKILAKEAKIGVIGMGYVGLPLVLRFGDVGFEVTGFDIDDLKVDKLNSGKSYIKHISSSVIKELLDSGRFIATSDFSELEQMDAVLICVPTPLNENRDPDLSFVESTAAQIAEYTRPGQLVALESTTYPGTTRDVLLPLFQNTGITVGKDLFLVYSPEREDPANPVYGTKNIPKILGGITPTCRDLGEALYSQIVDRVIPLSSAEAAEFTKILENIFRSVNIALVNELKVLANKMGVDIWEVIEAASTKPFGFMPFYPGPGLGGHCIPIDPFYLSWKAREYNYNTRFIELAGEVNSAMPAYVVSRAMEALNASGKCLKGAKILILGLAYKRDVDDTRESPALEIIKMLRDMGGEVFYHDPFIPLIPKVRKHDLKMKSHDLTEDFISGMDAVVVVTDHSSLDYQWIFEHAKIFIDTRNVIKNSLGKKNKLVKA